MVKGGNIKFAGYIRPNDDILVPMCQVWAKMWSKIKANILLMGMKVGIATLKSNQVSHQKNAKQNSNKIPFCAYQIGNNFKILQY